MQNEVQNDIESAIEGILFAAGEPVKLERICLALDLSAPDAEAALKVLADRYSYERRGMRIVRMEERWQMCSAPEVAQAIRRALEKRKPPQLSPTALEALAVVAYYQPTTKTYVEQIRGVDSSYTMNLLQERGLIEECGRLAVPGRPILYRTTDSFLRSFGLNTLEDLPPMPDSSPEDVQLTLQLETAVEQAEQAEVSLPEGV